MINGLERFTPLPAAVLNPVALPRSDAQPPILFDYAMPYTAGQESDTLPGKYWEADVEGGRHNVSLGC